MGHAGPGTSGGRRRLALVMLWCAAVLVLSGCLRYTADLTLAEDDTVSGTLVIAKKPPTGPDGEPVEATGAAASLEIPEPTSTSPRINIEPYQYRGQEGYKITFDDATFADMGAFTPGGSRGGTLAFFRDDDQVTISMSIDLTYADNVDNAQITSTFEGKVAIEVPGEVVETNGEVSGNVIVWNLKPLAMNSISATVDYPKGAPQAAGEPSGGTSWWVWAVAGALLAAGLAGWLSRRRSTGSGAPADEKRDRAAGSSKPQTGTTTASLAASTSAALAAGAASASLTSPEPEPPDSPDEPAATRATSASGAAYSAAAPAGDDQASTAGGWPPPRPHWRS